MGVTSYVINYNMSTCMRHAYCVAYLISTAICLIHTHRPPSHVSRRALVIATETSTHYIQIATNWSHYLCPMSHISRRSLEFATTWALCIRETMSDVFYERICLRMIPTQLELRRGCAVESKRACAANGNDERTHNTCGTYLDGRWWFVLFV